MTTKNRFLESLYETVTPEIKNKASDALIDADLLESDRITTRAPLTPTSSGFLGDVLDSAIHDVFDNTELPLGATIDINEMSRQLIKGVGSAKITVRNDDQYGQVLDLEFDGDKDRAIREGYFWLAS